MSHSSTITTRRKKAAAKKKLSREAKQIKREQRTASKTAPANAH